MKRRGLGVPPANEETCVATSPRPPARRLFARQLADELSHAFRTPLIVIGQYAAILREGLSGPLTDKQAEYLDIITTRVDDLSLAVDDVLDANALEAGLLKLWRREVRPAEILDRVQGAIERRAEARHVAFETEVGEPLPDVYCDPDQFGRAFGNLAAVALKHASAGGQVRLSANRIAGNQLVSPAAPLASPRGWPFGLSSAEEPLGLSVGRELIRLDLGTMRVQRHDGNYCEFTLALPSAEPLPLFDRYLNFLWKTLIARRGARARFHCSSRRLAMTSNKGS